MDSINKDINFEGLNDKLEEAKRLVYDNDHVFILKYIYATIGKGMEFTVNKLWLYSCFDIWILKPSEFERWFDRCLELGLIKVEGNEESYANRKVIVIINIDKKYEELLQIENIKKKDMKILINKILENSEYEFEDSDKNGIKINYKPKFYTLRINLSEEYKRKYSIISCDCLGWKYSRKCFHSTELKEKVEKNLKEIEELWKEVK